MVDHLQIEWSGHIARMASVSCFFCLVFFSSHLRTFAQLSSMPVFDSRPNLKTRIWITDRLLRRCSFHRMLKSSTPLIEIQFKSIKKQFEAVFCDLTLSKDDCRQCRSTSGAFRWFYTLRCQEASAMQNRMIVTAGRVPFDMFILFYRF